LQSFYSQIQNILKQENLELEKTKINILIRQLRRNDKQIFPFTKKLEHFINKSQQKHLTPLQIDEEVKNIQDKQEMAFIVIANQVYRKYEEEKKIKHWLDFNQILKLSSEKLEKHKCNLDLHV
jgi:superfamily I DNA/RNA helicase